MIYILLFMYVFSFPIKGFPSYIDSTMITSVISFGAMIVNAEKRKNFLEIITRKKILKIFSFLTLIIMFSLLTVLIHQTYDFSFTKVLVHQFFVLVTGIFIYSICRNKIKIVPALIGIFTVQGIIQLASFLSQNVRNFFNLFRSEAVILKGQVEYGNIRGLAVSGFAFFGLAVAFGLVFILYLAYWNEFQTTIVFKIAILGVLLFGAFSAGRSSVLGIGMAIIYMILLRKRPKKKSKLTIKKIIVFSLSLLLLVTGGMYLKGNVENNSEIKKNKNNMTNYLFQIVTSYKNTGRLETRSTDILFHRMYFPIETKTFVMGDGKYTNTDETYYMRTDAGYMRDILFFGIIGMTLLIVYQTLFLSWKRDSKNKYLSLFIMVYMLVTHVKGETVGFLLITQSMLLLILLEKEFSVSLKENKNVLGDSCDGKSISHNERL